MTTYPRIFLAYVLASIFCLGCWYYNPVPIPQVPVHAITSADVIAEVQRELKQKEIDKAAVVSARLYRAYGCPVALAQPTAVNSVTYHVPVRLSTAVVIVESTCRPRAISKAGAVGYWQVMPKLHHTTRKALYDRDTNFEIGTRYLSFLIHRDGMETGVAEYFGVTPGSDAAWDYAFHVFEVAGYRTNQ